MGTARPWLTWGRTSTGSRERPNAPCRWSTPAAGRPRRGAMEHRSWNLSAGVRAAGPGDIEWSVNTFTGKSGYALHLTGLTSAPGLWNDRRPNADGRSLGPGSVTRGKATDIRLTRGWRCHPAPSGTEALSQHTGRRAWRGSRAADQRRSRGLLPPARARIGRFVRRRGYLQVFIAGARSEPTTTPL